MTLRRPIALLAAAVTLLAIGCSTSAPDDATSSDEVNKGKGPTRDFVAHPAIVEISEADQVYALSDPHGHYEELAGVLEGNHLITTSSAGPTKAKWTGGTATLLILGDLIDKGEDSLEVIDLLRTIEKQAPASGGRVVVLMGNHEAEFLADPRNSKATSEGQDETGIVTQLDKHGIDPAKVAACKDTDGRGHSPSSAKNSSARSSRMASATTTSSAATPSSSPSTGTETPRTGTRARRKSTASVT